MWQTLRQANANQFHHGNNTREMEIHLHHHIAFQHAGIRKECLPLTAAVLKNFSELASETWKRRECNEQDITKRRKPKDDIVSLKDFRAHC